MENQPSDPPSEGRKPGKKQQMSTQRRQPSFKDRQKALARRADTSSGTPDGIITDLKKLSTLMEETCQISPIQAPIGLDVSAAGFVDICSTTYQSLVVTQPSLSDCLSEPEFLLASSWFLAQRSLNLMSTYFHRTVTGQLEFMRTMESFKTLPTPIAYYLSHFGVVTPPSGRPVVPQVVLPFRNDDDNLVGMEPGRFEDGYASISSQMFFYMVPFGSWKRSICNARTYHDGTYVAANANGQAQHSIDVRRNNPKLNDAVYTHLGCFPKIDGFLPCSHNRWNNIDPAAFVTYAGNDIRRSLAFNSSILNQYSLFLLRAQAFISMSNVPVSLDGDMSILTRSVGVRRTQLQRAQGFTFDVGYNLSLDSMIASRLFRYREIITYFNAAINFADQNFVNLNLAYDANEAYVTTVGQVDDTNFEISPVPEINTLLLSFVRKFMKTK